MQIKLKLISEIDWSQLLKLGKSWRAPALFQARVVAREVRFAQAAVDCVVAHADPNRKVLATGYIDLTLALVQKLAAPVSIFNAVLHEVVDELLCPLLVLLCRVLRVVS